MGRSGNIRGSKGALTRARRLLGLASATLAALASSCSSNGAAPQPADDTVVIRAGDGGGTIAEPACVSWSVRDCGIEIASHDGMVDCAQGKQICESGVWGACLIQASKGTTSIPAPSGFRAGESNRFLAVGGKSTTCIDNPCNPYCRIFNDRPDAAITADGSTITLDAAPGPSLGNSNVPPGIGNKGNDPNGVCTPGCTSQACSQACQFDMKCSTTTPGTCVGWGVGESGSCTGVDITAPTTCSVASGRNVTVCNRGTVAAPAGIECYLFPGNSQHMPEATPDIGSATKIMTTQSVIQPGYCETQTLSNSLFDSNGTEEMICNPDSTTSVAMTVSGFASTNQLVPAYAGWTSPENAYAADATYATATPVNAAGAQTAGPLFPSTNAAVGSAETWTSPNEAYTADGVSMSATPSTTATTYTVTKSPTADDSSLGSTAYTNDGNVGSVSISKGKSATINFSKFGITTADVPSGATISSITATVAWKVDDAGDPITTSVQMFDGTTAIGSAASVTYSNNDAPIATTKTIQTVTSGVTPAMLTDASGLMVAVTFDNLSSGKGVTILASIDYVRVRVKWNDGTTSSAVALGGFHFDNVVPSDATVTSLTVETKWNALAAATNATLAFQAYDSGGLSAISGATQSVTNPPTTATVSSVTVTNPGLLGSDLADANFFVQLSATRNSGSSFTALVDYVKVTALYTTTTVTNAELYGGFGFNLPANATVTKLTTEVKWFINTANNNAVLGAQPYIGAGATAVGTELTSSPPPTTSTVSTQVQNNPAVTATDLSDANFRVRVRATR